jgi:GTP-binding protein EngB required for normal cell division
MDDFLLPSAPKRAAARPDSDIVVNLSSMNIRAAQPVTLESSILTFVDGADLGGNPLNGGPNLATSLHGLLKLLPGEDLIVQELEEGEDPGAALDPLLRETSKHLKSIGRVNIVVAGQTGVGKSSLINAVFGEDFARTASGRPVTQTAEWFSSDTIPLRILDTKGLEAKDYAATVSDLRAEIETCRAMKDAKDQLHIGWVCISTPSSRIQDAEVDILRTLAKYDIPAIIVLTKYDDEPEFIEVVDQVLTERRVPRQAIVPVRAVAKKHLPQAGLSDLVVATFRALPSAHRAAFAAAQRVNLDLNKEAANEYVKAAAAAAAAAAVIPIPMADALSLAPIQTGMMVGISAAFGLPLDRQAVLQLMTTRVSRAR